MKLNVRFAFLAFLISTLLIRTSSSASDHQAGQVIVLLHSGKDVNVFMRRHSNMNDQATEIHISQQISEAMNIWLLNFNPSTDENALLTSILEDADVAAAQFNYFVQERTTPNDSLFPQQTNLYNTGQSGGKPGADIDAPDAWNISKGGITAQGDTIVIAVVDCGFDLPNPDLDFWKNYKEIPGNGIDDDGDGYIDDYDGWNSSGNGTIDWCAHGTLVSGIAGAIGNNEIGISGVNWNVKIMSVECPSTITDAAVITSYSYIVQMRKLYNTTNGAKGAFVVATNSSFGIDTAKAQYHPVWCAMYDSLGSVGILSATAGPNRGIDIDTQGDMPTTCPSDWMISVTNTTGNDNLYPAAGWGVINMDIGAPGDSIWGPVIGDQYGQFTGTSVATPDVCGAVALMWATACEEMIADYKNNPSALALAMKTIMLDNVDTLTDLTGRTVSDGRLNLYKSLLGVQDYCKKYIPVKPFSFDIYPNPAETLANVDFPASEKLISLQVMDVLGRNIFANYIQTANGQQSFETFQLDLTGMAPGMYFVKLTTVNNDFSPVHKLIVK